MSTLLVAPDRLPQSPAHDIAAPVSEDLRTRLAEARAEALALLPVVERLIAVYREAETVAVSAYPIGPNVAYDRLFDRCLQACGALALSEALDALVLVIDQP